MGYELVKLDENDEPFEVREAVDDNYFRLNTKMIGRASYLALWGAGIISGEEMIKYTTEANALNEETVSASELLSVHGVKTELKVSWLEPFTNNNKKTIKRRLCMLFADTLSNALDMIKDSPIQPDYELTEMVDFVEFLRSCEHGVWLE